MLQEQKNSIKNIPNIFLVISFLFGSIYCFTIPPMGLNDENRHFLRAYSYAYGKVYDDVYLPIGLFKITQEYYIKPFRNNTNKNPFREYKKYDLKKDDILQSIFKPRTESNQLVKISGNRSDVYTPLVYWPAIIVIFIGEKLQLPYLLIFYLCRLATLIAANLIIFYAIKNTPKFKIQFLLLSLIPVALTHRAAINADGLTFAYIFYFLSLLIKFKDEEEIPKNYFYKLSAACFAAALSKTAYLTILPLSLLLKSFKQYKLKYAIFLIIIPVLFSIIWAISIADKFDRNIVQFDFNKLDIFRIVPPNAEVNAGEKLNNIFHAPLAFIKLVALTLPHIIDEYLSYFTSGVIVGTVETNFLPALLCLIFLFFNNNQDVFSRKEKYFIHLINISVLFFIILLVYFTWTNSKDEYITGIQARYFIANTLLLLFTIKTRASDEQIKNINIISIIAFIALNISGVINVIEKCYEF